MKEFIFDVAFSFKSDCDAWMSVSRDKFILALRQRLEYLEKNPEEIFEAISFVDASDCEEDKLCE